jgi:pyruvate dehydrogenase E2 component (dihydrolipoamide acetyltransferase)/2-oxoglutarate dehydrogenase E2 component (dihydrolipoamide succinyltransferase)
MAEEILMPKLAMAMKQGKVIEWKAKEGQWVEKGQIVMVIETEKVTYECESPASGFLHIIVELDKAIPVNDTVALLAETEAELAGLQAEQPAPAGAVEAAAETVPEAAVAATAAPPAGPVKKGKVRISPAAKKMAVTHNLDFTRVSGSGPGGRIVKKDIIQALETGLPEAAPPVEVAVEVERYEGKKVARTIPLRGMRQAIAEHMVHSLTVSAQLTLSGEIDMTEMIRFRKMLLGKQDQIGLRISYTDLMVYVLAKAVKQVPIVNSSLIDNEIKIWEDINIGVAVSLEVDEAESGLIVPVVKNAGQKSLLEISQCIKDLTNRARNGELTADDMADGTLTLSNTGVFAPGWTVSTPIINQPQSVIVLTGGIVEQPMAVNGEVVVRPVMTTSITFDHRVMDGAPIHKFLTKFKDLIEQPELLHL